MAALAATGRRSLQSWRELLTIVLVALLPLHALLVTLSTRLIAGPGHAPLPWLALWKELLFVVILGLAAVEIVQIARHRRRLPASDLLDVLVVAFFVVAVASATWHDTSLAKLALGLRYDVLAPLGFVILRKVPWSAAAGARMRHTLLIVAAGVAAFGLLGLVLPLSAFGWLGYATNFHSLYLPDSPLAPFSQIGETMIRRAQSTLSGPNQFGLWLTIPLAILMATLSHRRALPWRSAGLGALLLAALFATFSRTAWIGAAAGLIAVGSLQVHTRTLRRWFLPVTTGLIAVAVIGGLAAPQTVIRASSTRGHFEQPIAAITRLAAHPWGEGLASAGPASSRFADACVKLRPEDDPSWAKAQPELCVFLGDKQVQPTDRLCRCPFHPENWYLQLGVELGWPGLLLWLAIIGLTLWRLLPLVRSRETAGSTAAIAQLSLAVGCLFLHAWEDVAVAFTIWILTAIALSHPSSTEEHRI